MTLKHKEFSGAGLPKLKQSQIRRLDRLLEMRDGYVLDFSNRTFSEFFEDEFGFDIYQEKYELQGESKAKRLRTLIEVEERGVSCCVGYPEVVDAETE